MEKRFKVMACIFSVVALLVTIVVVYYFGAFYPKFNKISKKEFEIPGLADGFVPQGLEYVEDKDIFLISGYMADGSPSRVYVINGETGETQKYITLETTKNEDYVGHAGGIAVSTDFVYVVGDKVLNALKLEDVLSAENGSKIKFVDSFETGNGCDFVSKVGEKLVVGEFYRKGKYETEPSHHIKINEKEENNALAFVYEFDEESSLGIKSEPIAALSLPNQAQGLTTTKEGSLVVSTSFSIPDSKILIYDNVFDCDAELIFEEKNIPLFVLSSSKLKQSITSPCMTEEVVLAGDRVFVLFESACSKYKMINRTRIKNVFSLEI